MKTAELDRLIANLGKALFTSEELFENLARNEGQYISVDDLTYLCYFRINLLIGCKGT